MTPAKISEADAERRLSSVDRVDLIGWLGEGQRMEREWRSRFRRLYNDVRKWHEHLARQEAGDTSDDNRGLGALLRLPAEVLEAPDPLAKILEEHRETDPAQDGML